jgi:hypothetical protein
MEKVTSGTQPPGIKSNGTRIDTQSRIREKE